MTKSSPAEQKESFRILVKEQTDALILLKQRLLYLESIQKSFSECAENRFTISNPLLWQLVPRQILNYAAIGV